jgi:hypothetical protein
LPTLFQTSCAPGLYPSEVTHADGRTAFLPFRTDWWFLTRPLIRASTSGRQVPPPLGFAPPARPSPDCGVLPRNLARASPGFLLFEVCPSARAAGSSASFRPLACSPTSHPVRAKLPLGVFTAGRPSRSIKSAGQSRQTPNLAIRDGPGNPCEVPTPFHDSVAEDCPNELA